MRLALAGTRGVPAEYGGFETALEEIGRRLVARGHDVTVYARGRAAESEYLGMRVVHRPAFRRKSLETLTHSLSTLPHILRARPDFTFVFNAANMPAALALRAARLPFAVHVDGLEWKRSKWGPVGRRYYLASEWLAAHLAPARIADAEGIAHYYHVRYGVTTTRISYGVNAVDPDLTRLKELRLEAGLYSLVVARLEPENHVLPIVRGYAARMRRCELVVVGDAPYGDRYKRALADESGGGVRFLGSIYDQSLLDALYAGSALYLHGHSVGGTNPSLLRAAAAGVPIAAWDTEFNREVLGDQASYFDSAEQLDAVLSDPNGDVWAKRRGELLQDSVRTRYDWDLVTDAYEDLASSLGLGQRDAR